MRRTAVAILIVCFQGTNAAVADTHYVSHDGTKTYPYTSWATATDSILEAIRAADEWDTVLLAAAIYTADSLPLKKGLALLGAGRDSTRIVHNGNYPVCIIVADSCMVQGVHLQGQTDTSFGNVTFHLHDGVLGFTDQSAVIRDSRFSDMEYGLEALWTDALNPGKRVVLENNEFSNFFMAVAYWYCSSGIIGNTFLVNYNDIGASIRQDEGNAEIRNNYFLRVVPFSIPLIDLQQCDTIWLRNNICISTASGYGAAIYSNFDYSGYPTVGEIENNLCVGAELGIWSGGGDVRIRNNIVAGTALAALYYDTLSTTFGSVGFNLYWDNTYAWGLPRDMSLRPDPGNIFADPMFVDSLDFHLQAFSPAIDAGDSLLLDVDGTRSDIGPYGGPNGETYIYLDLPPGAPKGFTDGGFYDAKQTLTWRRNSESDFARYELFRDVLPIESADSALLRAVITADTSYADTLEIPESDYYYRLRAVDAQGNASALSNEIWHIHAAVDGDDGARPESFALHPNYPNPFNASTRFEIDIPTAGSVHVGVYDILGRRMETLHDDVMPVGRHSFAWTPEHAGSGVYFLVAKFAGMTRVGKMLLLK